MESGNIRQLERSEDSQEWFDVIRTWFEVPWWGDEDTMEDETVG